MRAGSDILNRLRVPMEVDSPARGGDSRLGPPEGHGMVKSGSVFPTRRRCGDHGVVALDLANLGGTTG
ncbi:hypothetical protein Ssi02_33360 [Sinosporangium siamense]|uniref:Uncharacterized protein n=1 Tax=Sinosporangium siamense TaxID=1367973 RepID=A0A919V5K1_9ACTN|nr:hypothetical protein Ssi02_33360 [Sinosporangium siamense]